MFVLSAKDAEQAIRARPLSQRGRKSRRLLESEQRAESTSDMVVREGLFEEVPREPRLEWGKGSCRGKGISGGGKALRRESMWRVWEL